MIKALASHLPRPLQRRLRRLNNRLSVFRRNFSPAEPEAEILHHLVREGDRVVDGGANVGHYTVLLSQLVGSAGRVLAFEPVPDTFALLSENVRRFDCSNVTLINAALSRGVAERRMQVPVGRSGLENFYAASLTNPESGGGQAGPAVLLLPLEHLVSEEPVALIKLDLEGHEEEAFVGMQDLVSRDHPIMIVETRPSILVETLEREGYEIAKLPSSPNTIFIPPERKHLLGRFMP